MASVNELLERLTKVQEDTQRNLVDLQWVVTNTQAEATKKVVQKLEEERNFQFWKKGNKKQFRFNQSTDHHFNAAKDELSKIELQASILKWQRSWEMPELNCRKVRRR